MLYLFKLIDRYFHTHLYFHIRLSEISDLLSEKSLDPASRSLQQLLDDCIMLGYSSEYQSQCLYHLAEICYKSGNPEESVEYCKKALTVLPCPDYLYRIGWLFFYCMKSPQQSIPYFSQSLEKCPEHYPSLKAIGEVHLQLQNYEESEKSIRLALSYRNDPDCFLWLGQMLMSREKYQDAFKSFSASLKLKPENPEVNYYIGCLFLRDNDHSNALHYFRQATYYDNRFTAAYFEIARIHHLLLNETDKAIIAYNKILEMLPDNEEALYNLSLLFFRNKHNQKRALSLLHKIIRINPESSQSHQLLSELYASCYNYALALRHLELSDQSAPEIRIRKADLYYRMCNFDQAETLYIDLYQQGFAEMEDKLKKIVLFSGLKAACFLCFSYEQDNIGIYAVKRNGPFLTDTLKLRLLNKYPEDDTFCSFEPYDFTLEEGFLILSRWLDCTVLTLGQSLAELNHAAAEFQIELSIENIVLDQFLFTLNQPVPKKEELSEMSLKQRCRTIVTLFQQSLKKIRDSHLLISQFSRLEKLKELAHLPQLTFRKFHLDELKKELKVDTSSVSSLPEPDQELTSFISLPNFTQSWRAVLLPGSSNNLIFSSIKELSEKKKFSFALLTKSSEDFCSFFRSVSESGFDPEAYTAVTEPENHLCMLRIEKLISSGAYPEEIFFFISWYKDAPVRLFQFIPADGLTLFPRLARVLYMICAGRDCLGNACTHSESCSYHRMNSPEKKKLYIFSPECSDRGTFDHLLQSAVVVFCHDFPYYHRLTYKKSVFSLLKLESLLFFAHQLLLNSEDIAPGSSEELIIKTTESVTEVRRIILSIRNHYLLPDQCIDLDSLKLKFPFLYYSFFDALLPVSEHLKLLLSAEGTVSRFCKQEFTFLQNLLSDFLFSTCFRIISLNRDSEEITFSVYESPDQRNFPQNLIFIENRLPAHLAQQLASTSPGRQINQLDLYSVSEKGFCPELTDFDFFSAENKFFHRLCHGNFWSEFLRFRFIAELSSSGNSPDDNTVSFAARKKLRYHFQISKDNLDHVLDNIFYHIDSRGFYDFLALSLSKDGKPIFCTLKNVIHLAAVSAVVSRVEGKRVLIVAPPLMTDFLTNIFSGLYYFESLCVTSSMSRESLSRNLEILSGGIPRIIITDFQMYHESSFTKTIAPLRIDYTFSLTYLSPDSKVIAAEEPEDFHQNKLQAVLKEKSDSADSDFTCADLRNHSLTPCFPSLESITVSGMPFNTRELGVFLTSASSLELKINEDELNVLSAHCEQLRQKSAFFRLSKIFSTFCGQKIMISRKLLSQIISSCPFASCEDFLDFALSNRLISELNYYISGNDQFPGIEDLCQSSFNFALSSGHEKARKLWLEHFFCEIKLLEFFSKDHELVFKKKKDYPIEILAAAIESSEALDDILSAFCAANFISRQMSENICSIEIHETLNHMIKIWISRKEIRSIICDYLFSACSQSSDCASLSEILEKLHPRFTPSAAELEEALLDLSLLGIVRIVSEKPLLKKSYSFRILSEEIPSQPFDDLSQSRFRLHRIIRAKLKETKQLRV